MARTGGLEVGFGVTTPRERREADLFFADLMGHTVRGQSAEDEVVAAERVGVAARSSVFNPGASTWVAMAGSVPAKKEPWAGAVRQRTDPSTDYEGWERVTEPLTIESAGFGTAVDLLFAASVKGRVKGTEDQVYVTEATVRAFEPRAIGVLFPRIGVVDVEVGRVKARWDFDKRCARLEIPVRVEFRAHPRKPHVEAFTFVWFGNGEAPSHPFAPGP